MGAEAALSNRDLLPASRSPFRGTAVSRAVAQRLTLAIRSVVPLEFSLCTRHFAWPSEPVVTTVLLDRMRELGPPPRTQRQHHTAASPWSAFSRQTVPSTLAQHGFELQAPTKRQIFSKRYIGNFSGDL